MNHWILNTQPVAQRPVQPPTVPPVPKPKLNKYMTVMPSRSPVQKMHANFGHVKNAINAKMGYVSGGYTLFCDVDVYELQGDKLVLLHSFPKGTVWQDIPWVKEAKEKQDEKERIAEEKRQSTFLGAAEALGEMAVKHTSADVDDVEDYVQGFVDAFKLFQAGRYIGSVHNVRGMESSLTKLA